MRSGATAERERAGGHDDPADEAVYHITHDLRAPVKAVSMLADWIAEDMGPAGVPNIAVAQHLKDIKTQSARLDRMLRDLLVYSRAGRPGAEASEVSLRDLIARIVTDRGLEHRFVVRVELELDHLWVPASDFHALLDALIDNAARHHDRKTGLLTITCQLGPDGLLLRVCDDGPGIARDYHDRIFQPMTTLQPRDTLDTTGLGLAIVRKIAASLDGAVHVQSSEHRRGTVFEVCLPARCAVRPTAGRPAIRQADIRPR